MAFRGFLQCPAVVGDVMSIFSHWRSEHRKENVEENMGKKGESMGKTEDGITEPVKMYFPG